MYSESLRKEGRPACAHAQADPFVTPPRKRRLPASFLASEPKVASGSVREPHKASRSQDLSAESGAVQMKHEKSERPPPVNAKHDAANKKIKLEQQQPPAKLSPNVKRDKTMPEQGLLAGPLGLVLWSRVKSPCCCSCRLRPVFCLVK